MRFLSVPKEETNRILVRYVELVTITSMLLQKLIWGIFAWLITNITSVSLSRGHPKIDLTFVQHLYCVIFCSNNYTEIRKKNFNCLYYSTLDVNVDDHPCQAVYKCDSVIVFPFICEIVLRESLPRKTLVDLNLHLSGNLPPN